MALRIAKVSNEFIRKIAQEYLLDFATMKKLAKKHGTSPGTISNILFKGVTECILDDLTAQAVANKAMNNTDNIVRTRKRWNKAMEIRQLPDLEEELKFEEKKLEELQFQLETYNDFFSNETNAPTKQSLHSQIQKLKKDIKTLKNYIAKLRG